MSEKTKGDERAIAGEKTDKGERAMLSEKTTGVQSEPKFVRKPYKGSE